MFQGCSIYYYMGLYLDENMLKTLEIQKANGLEIIFMLQNYDYVYSFEDNEFHEIDKISFLSMLSNEDNKYQEFCYRIRNGCFVLVPTIQIFYGISDYNENLIASYNDKLTRDAKLSLINSNGIHAITEDMSKGREKILEFNHQRQLKKVYSALTMTVE